MTEERCPQCASTSAGVSFTRSSSMVMASACSAPAANLRMSWDSSASCWSRGDFGKLLPLEENQQTGVGVQGLLVVQVLHLCREEAFFRNTKAGGVKLPFVKRRMVLRGKTGRSAGKNGTCRGKTCLSGEKNTLSRREWSAIIILLWWALFREEKGTCCRPAESWADGRARPDRPAPWPEPAGILKEM